MQAAIDELERDEQIQLWVAYVDSFSGVNAQEWADETAEQSDLGLSDVLLAVATEDRAYAYSVDEQFPLSNDELARIANQEIEPELSDGDWAGAAIAAASGLEAREQPRCDGRGRWWFVFVAVAPSRGPCAARAPLVALLTALARSKEASACRARG